MAEESTTALTTGSFSLPVSVTQGIWEKAQQGSVIARLSDAFPQQYGASQVMTLTGEPVAELVGESAQKSPTPATYESKTITPYKLQVTMRASQEVKWADEDYQLGVFADLENAAGVALGRALDFVGLHKLNPLSGGVSNLVSSGITDTENSASVSGDDYGAALEEAVGDVIEGGYTPSGIALAPSMSFALATQKDSEGRRLYPELGFGLADTTAFQGVPVAVSSTVNADDEVLAFVGDWSAIRWGVQREVTAHLIEYGDPDGLGDLQRNNQVALRAEIVYGIAVLDLGAFAKVTSATVAE